MSFQLAFFYFLFFCFFFLFVVMPSKFMCIAVPVDKFLPPFMCVYIANCDQCNAMQCVVVKLFIILCWVRIYGLAKRILFNKTFHSFLLFFCVWFCSLTNWFFSFMQFSFLSIVWKSKRRRLKTESETNGQRRIIERKMQHINQCQSYLILQRA